MVSISSNSSWPNQIEGKCICTQKWKTRFNTAWFTNFSDSSCTILNKVGTTHGIARIWEKSWSKFYLDLKRWRCSGSFVVVGKNRWAQWLILMSAWCLSLSYAWKCPNRAWPLVELSENRVRKKLHRWWIMLEWASKCCLEHGGTKGACGLWSF